MRLGPRAAAPVLGLLLAGTASLAQSQEPDARSQEVVAAFAAACVPARLSYEGTTAEAVGQGWMAIEQTAHPELNAMMAQSAALLADPEFPIAFEFQAFGKEIGGRQHHLVVTRAESEPVEDMGPFVDIGCYLYNFDATELIDPAAVTALIGNPIAHSTIEPDLSGHVWGPPCAMPRTLDTYLTLIPEGSQAQAKAGFSGMVLKFSTSEPDPGEVVPETYC